MSKQTTSKVPQIRFKGFEEGWLEDQLGERVEFFSGLTYSPRNVQKGVGTLVLRSSNVKNGEIVNADNVYVDPKIVNSKNVEVGDIAVVVRNGSRSLIGKHAQIKSRMDNTVIGAFMTGIHSENPAFTNALLDTPQFDKEIAKNLGATINQITTGAFRQMTFRFPRRTEQTQIGGYFRELDRLIGLHQRKHDKLVTLKKAMLQKMFPQQGATTPEIRFKGFEGDWEAKKLSELCDLFTDGDWIESKDQSVSGIRLLQTGNVGVNEFIDKADKARWISLDTFERLKCEEVFAGDILISRLPEPAGRACIVPKLPHRVITAVDCTIVRTTKNCDPSFLVQHCSLHSYFETVNNYLGGGTRQRISRSALGKFIVKIPKFEEQQKIGGYFRTLDELISKYATQMQKLRQIKSACLEKMFV